MGVDIYLGCLWVLNIIVALTRHCAAQIVWMLGRMSHAWTESRLAQTILLITQRSSTQCLVFHLHYVKTTRESL
jgi:hypothetical protein